MFYTELRIGTRTNEQMEIVFNKIINLLLEDDDVFSFECADDFDEEE